MAWWTCPRFPILGNDCRYRARVTAIPTRWCSFTSACHSIHSTWMDWFPASSTPFLRCSTTTWSTICSSRCTATTSTWTIGTICCSTTSACNAHRPTTEVYQRILRDIFLRYKFVLACYYLFFSHFVANSLDQAAYFLVLANTNVRFSKNCIFFDISEFNLKIFRSGTSFLLFRMFPDIIV